MLCYSMMLVSFYLNWQKLVALDINPSPVNIYKPPSPAQYHL